jgi:hypothetical protein
MTMYLSSETKEEVKALLDQAKALVAEVVPLAQQGHLTDSEAKRHERLTETADACSNLVRAIVVAGQAGVESTSVIDFTK